MYEIQYQYYNAFNIMEVQANILLATLTRVKRPKNVVTKCVNLLHFYIK